MKLARLSPLALVAFLLGCPGDTGTFDGGNLPDAGPNNQPTAADIGTVCEYNSDGLNPTDTCPSGLSCLIYTFDGQYAPNPPGAAANFTLHNWEDQFTIYRPDGVDEGYCTLIGTWDNPPACPFGSTLKLLSTNLAVCLKDCVDASECARTGYTCDYRFLDLPGGTCVRGCQYDYPECVRNGQFQRPPQQGQQPVVALHLEVADLTGASVCDVGSGVCVSNPGLGTAAPGMPCNTTADCGLESVCIQSEILQSVNPNLAATVPGFCAQPCKPDAQMPLSGGCRTGFACQAGLTLGFGTPLDPNIQDANGYLLVNSSQGSFLEAGGWCFPDCQATGGDCSSHPGTTCGAADTTTFGQPWNQVSMCLLDPLRQ